MRKDLELNKEFNTITGDKLLAMDFPPINFVVENLLPRGLHILAGLPKVGKSWLALWLALTVAKGEKVWGNTTTQGTSLYLCFEDPDDRVQSRLMEITEDAPNNVHFCTEICTLHSGLLERIQNFKTRFPNTNLIIIDTLQMIKDDASDGSYASDYADLVPLKELAYQLNVAIVLIHHLKKRPEVDKFNQISGTTGLQGVVDGMYILDQKRDLEDLATLYCIGRDIGRREIEMKKNSENLWDKLKDSMEEELSKLAKLKEAVTSFLKTQPHFLGTATDLSSLLQSHSVDKFSPRTLSKNLLICQKDLEKSGIVFSNRRSNGKRLIELTSCSDDSVDENSIEVVADTVSLSALETFYNSHKNIARKDKLC